MSAISLQPPKSGRERPRRTPKAQDGRSLVAPVALLGAAAGVGAAENPLIGLGLGSLVLLTFLPWAALFTVLVGTAIANRAGYQVGGLTIRLAVAALVPFAFRAFFFTNRSLRPRWKAAEWFLVLFIMVNFIVSWFMAVSRKGSIIAAGVEALGAIAYLAVYTSVCSPERARKAARIFLLLGAIGAIIGILSLGLYFVGFSFGVDFRYKPLLGGAPSIKGLAYEHDLFGSTCAAVAMAFYILRREGSTLFSRKWTVRLLWCSFIGMLIAQGRGAWLGFGFVFLLYYVFKKRRVVQVPRVVRTSVILLLVALLGFGAFFSLTAQTDNGTPGPLNAIAITTATKLSTIVDTSTGTGAGRVRLWTKGTSEVMATSPIWGLGTYSYGQRNFRPSPHTAPYLTPGYLISLWVRTLYDTGIVGVCLLALFMLFAFWPKKELQTSSGDLAPVSRAFVFASLVLAASYLITDSTLLIWPWLLFGMTRAVMGQAVNQARALAADVGHSGNGNGRPAAPALAIRSHA
jgi:hypothetical protein